MVPGTRSRRAGLALRPVNAATTGNTTTTFTVAATGTGLAITVPATPLNNTTPLTAMSLTGDSGSNSASWNPTLVVSVPAAAVAGTYSGTVTHAVG